MMKLCSTSLHLCKEVSVKPYLHAAVCSAVDPQYFITFGQHPGPAVIVPETVPYQIIQEISEARGKNTVAETV